MRDINFENQPPRFKGKVITDQLAGSITRVEELAYIIRVDEVMTTKLITIPPSDSMEKVARLMRENHISGVLVTKKEDLVGLVSTEDLIKCLSSGDLSESVSKYMATDIITLNSFDYLTEALKNFAKTGLGRLPVLNKDKKVVGIITKGDITYGFLKALEHDYHEEEVRRYRASHLFEDIESDRTSLILRYTIKHYDFMRGGSASSNIKKALLRLGANPQLARRVGIAVYEAEMNLIIHTDNGGSIHVEIEPHQISIYAWDNGPGIPNVDEAMKPGYSTASEEIRELGFGAGMGLCNISRCVDEMKLESELGKGTQLTMKVFLKEDEVVGEGYQTEKE